MKEQFTKYELARILGARALQIAMDAPILLKMSDEELKEISYNPIKIAERELDSGVLPISVHKPMPRRKGGPLEIKEEKIDDKEIIKKEKEIEEEISEKAEELGFAPDDESEDDDHSNGDDD